MVKPVVLGYSDADWAGHLIDRKSTSGTSIVINEIPTVWRSQKQTGVALSSCESDYIALSECTKLIKWVRALLEESGLLKYGPTVVMEDNTGTIKWSKSEKMSKSADIRRHFVKDESSKGTIEVLHCRTEEMLADLVTKGLTTERVRFLREALCIDDIFSESEVKEGC